MSSCLLFGSGHPDGWLSHTLGTVEPRSDPAGHRIRPCRPYDLGALYDICLRTGDAGEDATGRFRDGRLPGDLFAAPYALLEPDLAFVLDDGTGTAVGYVLAAADTIGFEAACEQRWWPTVRRRHRDADGVSDLDRTFTWLLHHRPAPDPAVVERYPSHLHIDLLPSAQGRGLGRRMMERVLDTLDATGSRGVHWGVSTRNHRASGFYDAIGARRIAEDRYTVTYAVDLAGDPR